MGIGIKNKISSFILGITLVLVLIASPTLVSFTQVSEILVYAQIVDTISPVVTPPANQSFEATAILTPLDQTNYGTATATDNLDPNPVIMNNAPTTFPLGATTIIWIAIDANGNVGTATQTVTIVDTTAPTVTAPANQSFEATAILTPLDQTNYGTATATDNLDPNPTITNDAPATFPLG